MLIEKYGQSKKPINSLYSRFGIIDDFCKDMFQINCVIEKANGMVCIIAIRLRQLSIVLAALILPLFRRYTLSEIIRSILLTGVVMGCPQAEAIGRQNAFVGSQPGCAIAAKDQQSCLPKPIYRLPADPDLAARTAMKAGDFRLAGWVSPNMIPGRKVRPRPYGLICKSLPENGFKYLYQESDAIDRDAMTGHRPQKKFLRSYNRLILHSGMIPAAWSCNEDSARNKEE